jgi:hypothetical protein
MEEYLFHSLILSHIITKVLDGALFGTGEEAAARRRRRKNRLKIIKKAANQTSNCGTQ